MRYKNGASEAPFLYLQQAPKNGLSGFSYNLLNGFDLWIHSV